MENTQAAPAALVPTRQQIVDFYGDPIPVAQAADGGLYVPLRPLTDFLGVDFSGQRQRVLRDEVLAPRLRPVVLAGADGRQRELLCLPLSLLPGWLFSIQPSRVKPELAPKLRQYRAECFDVLWQAFKGDVVPAAPPSTATGAALALEIAGAVYALAQQQVAMETRLDQVAGHVADVAGRQTVMADYLRTYIQQNEQRVSALELHLSAGATISEAQAAELALAVKNVGQRLASQGDKQGYAKVYSEMYRRYRISSYKNLPAAHYQAVLDWLSGWYGELQGQGPESA
jgi:hypothetical protein